MKKTVKIPQAQATDEQLRNFAVMTCGLQLEPGDSRATLIARIATVAEVDMIPIEVDDTPIETMGAKMLDIGGTKPNPYGLPQISAARLQSKGAAYLTDPHVCLVIAREEKEGGDEPVPVSVNGAAMWIPRGQMVEIPYRYFVALMNAVKEVFTQKDIYGALEGRMVPALPIDVKWAPSDEVVREWTAKTNTLQLAPEVEAA